MAQIIENDGWTNVRIRNGTVDDIKKFMKENPVFDSHPQVVEYAVRRLLERGVKK